MKKIYLPIVLLWLFSCKPHLYRQTSVGMEATIMEGEKFFVTFPDEYKRNDIVIFDYYGPDFTSYTDDKEKLKMHWEKRVYRLIAYSGDSVEIKNGEVFVNSNHVPLPRTAELVYRVRSKVPINEFEDRDPTFTQITRFNDTIEYSVSLTSVEALDYEQRKPAILSVKRIWNNVTDTSYARDRQTGNWSTDNYGPFKIPSPNDTIFIDDINFNFYKNIPGMKKGLNVINEKLYFVLGDNRHHAADSRFIGLISHSKMYGVAK